MTATTLSNLIEPEVFNPYVIERTAEKAQFFQSGVVSDFTEVRDKLMAGGNKVQMPFFTDLSGDDNILDETNNITVSNISADQIDVVRLAREKGWGATDLSAYFSGADPMRAIGDLVADYWARRLDALVFALAKGALGSSAANTSDISGGSGSAAYIDAESFIDAAQKLGDAKDMIAAIAMHSNVEAYLNKQDLIDYIRDSQGNFIMRTYMGKRVVLDDTLAAASSVYSTILFSPGCIGYINAPGNLKETEVDRDPETSGGLDKLYTRRAFMMGVRGISWTPVSGVPAKHTPSNAEILDTGNWTRKYEAKNVGAVLFKHKIG